MSCERYQQMLHLNRSGEVSAEDADDLRQHLTRCETCSLEWRRIQHADKFLNPLRTFSPALAGPEKLTADIMRRVREAALREPSQSIIDRILDFFLIPAVRYTAVATILGVLVMLIFQSFTLLNQISNLEQRMISMPGHRAGATYTVRSETLQEVTESEKIQSFAGSAPLMLGNGRIQVPAKDVDAFLSDSNLRDLPAIIGWSALRIDQKTLEKIISEIKATAELTFRAG
jgi:hypothetical protein